MTDQKIEEIRARDRALLSNVYRPMEPLELDRHLLIKELDRLKAELNDCSSLIGDQAKVMVARSNRILELNAELATLKASGTFSDGVEAADAAVVKALNEEPNDKFWAGLEIALKAIRALSPQPRPDAQAQRERELALVDHAIRYERTHGGVIGVYAPEGLIKCLEAFNRSQS